MGFTGKKKASAPGKSTTKASVGSVSAASKVGTLAEGKTVDVLKERLAKGHRLAWVGGRARAPRTRTRRRGFSW